MNEIWKAVKGYEGLYEVSNLGRVRSMDRLSNGKKHKGKIKSTYVKNEKQYDKTSLHNDKGETKYFKVHQLVANAFIEYPRDGNKYEVNHIDGNIKNNRVENLEWMTRKQNLDYKKVLGTILKGDSHQNSKLNSDIVKFIKDAIKNKTHKQKELAKMFNISESVISSIKKGNTWSHIN